MPITTILTDIEGTTSSISFVKEVLFPYARQHLAKFVQQHQKDSEVQYCLNSARELVQHPEWTDAQVVQQLIQWIDEDRKATPLKTLQGLIWADGYQQGAYMGHIYPEVAENLAQWQAAGKRLFVFSSGSIAAQKLLFGYSEAGDLTPYFSGYFDTTIGNKREIQAYQVISQQIGEHPDNILFLSDIKEELTAAQTAGMKTCQLVRDASTVLAEQQPQATDFNQVKQLFALVS